MYLYHLTSRHRLSELREYGIPPGARVQYDVPEVYPQSVVLALPAEEIIGYAQPGGFVLAEGVAPDNVQFYDRQLGWRSFAQVYQPNIGPVGAAKINLRQVRAEGRAAMRKQKEDCARQRLLLRESIDEAESLRLEALDRARGEMSPQRRAAYAAAGRRSHEKRSEMFDAARRDAEVMGPGMGEVFDQVAHSLYPPKDRMSLSEAFAEWAHKNPEEIYAIQEALAEQATAGMIADVQEEEWRQYQESQGGSPGEWEQPYETYDDAPPPPAPWDDEGMTGNPGRAGQGGCLTIDELSERVYEG